MKLAEVWAYVLVSKNLGNGAIGTDKTQIYVYPTCRSSVTVPIFCAKKGNNWGCLGYKTCQDHGLFIGK